MKRAGLSAVLMVLLLLPREAGAGSFLAEAGELSVELASDPGRPIRGRDTAYTLWLREASGQPVAGAKVTLMGRMSDGMTVLAPLRESSQAGMYSGRVLFTMEGEWQLTLRILRAGTPLEPSFTEQVGR